jgi:hypothetical protein
MSEFDYYNFRVKYASDIIEDEIKYYTSHNSVCIEEIRNYVNYLRMRIGIDKIESRVVIQYDKSGNSREIKKMNIQEHSKDMDLLEYKKPWIRLQKFHKNSKIKEYIETLTYDESLSNDDILKNKEYLRSAIMIGINDKKFGKGKNEIIYDIDSMKILSIDAIVYHKKRKIYKVEFNN